VQPDCGDVRVCSHNERRWRTVRQRAVASGCTRRTWRAEAARRLREATAGRRGGPRRGWSCVGRGILEHGWLAASAWRGAARRGAAWRGATRQGEPRRGETRFGSAQRGAARRSGGGSVGRLACLLTRALACGYVRSSPIPVLLSHARSLARLRPRPRRAPRRASVSLRAVLLPSHREAASKQEPIWISVDLFLHSLSLSPLLSISLSVASFFFFNRCLIRLRLHPSGFGVNEN